MLTEFVINRFSGLLNSTFIRLDMSRLVYALTSLLFVQLGFIFSFFDTDQNVYNLLAACVGSVVAQFFVPKGPARAIVGGWLVGFLLSMLFGKSLYNAHLLHAAIEETATFAIIALAGNLLVQLIAWIVRVASKVGVYAEQNPGQAFDEGLDRAERTLTVWMRLKAPLLDAIDTFRHLFPKKP